MRKLALLGLAAFWAASGQAANSNSANNNSRIQALEAEDINLHQRIDSVQTAPAQDSEARQAICALYNLQALPAPAFCPPPTNTAPSNIFLRFRGGTDNVSIPNNSTLIVDNALTLDAFINIQGPGGIGPRILEIIDTFSLHLYRGQLSFCLFSNGWTCVSTNQPPNNTWAHVAGTWDGTTMRLFVNGVVAAATNFSGPLNHGGPGDQTLKIGNGWTFIDGFDGFIDEVSVSRSARYSANFAVQNPLLPDSETVGLWHFDLTDINTPTAIDSSANGNHGTVTGAQWVEN